MTLAAGKRLGPCEIAENEGSDTPKAPLYPRLLCISARSLKAFSVSGRQRFGRQPFLLVRMEEADERLSASDAQFGVYIGDVILDRMNQDEEFLPYLSVASATEDKLWDVGSLDVRPWFRQNRLNASWTSTHSGEVMTKTA